jgi:hypothetical protein
MQNNMLCEDGALLKPTRMHIGGKRSIHIFVVVIFAICRQQPAANFTKRRDIDHHDTIQ